MPTLPLIQPRPPRIADHLDAFARIEAAGIYSNNGPELRRFEAACTAQLFGQHGRSLGVANATLGLMLAIAEAAGDVSRDRFAIVPALTFAATGQAAWWAGLTPLIADVTPDSWELDPVAVERLIDEHGDRVACVVPYAPFGAPLDLDWYAALQRRHRVGVVIDAAASLGSRDEFGLGFGAAAPFACVYSMHATKTFAVGEGGLVHSGDRARIERLRVMAGFGFDGERSATLPGLNAKLSEANAVLAAAKLTEIDRVVAHRAALEDAYRLTLTGFQLQAVPAGGVRASQFLPVLLPPGVDRAAVTDRLAADGIGCGAYFSPHLGEQPWFRQVSRIEPTPVADDVAARIVSLPITDAMSTVDAVFAADRFATACRARRSRRTAPRVAGALVIGGGPAGTAMLTAASKSGALERLCADGLVVAERDAALGIGRLGRYAINSDSTAQTFLTAVKDNPWPELAAIADRAEGRCVAGYTDALGVPLVDAGPLIRATGDALGGIVVRHGGQVLTRHEAIDSRRDGDGWVTRFRRLSDGTEVERRSRTLVVATGGHQPLDRLAVQQVAGAPLARLAAGRLVQSDSVLAVGGMATVRDLLDGKHAPRIAVIGGSTSALTTVALLLKQRLSLGAGAITLLHRRPLRPFYPSVDAAQAEGFTDFGPDDICPVSGFVYRLAGFRLEARELVLRMLEVGGRVPDPRIATHRIAGSDDEVARDIVRDADLVVAALGYRPFAHPLLNVDGSPIALAAGAGRAMVDRHCRILDAEDRPVPGAYGIGLAAGFVPWGRLGGEASFRGQANGLWLWQNDIGQMIVDQLLDPAATARAAA